MPNEPGPAYAVGDAVEIAWGTKWFAGRVVRAVDASHWEVGYDGWAETWNEVVGPERLRRPGEAKDLPGAPPAAPRAPLVFDGPLAGVNASDWSRLEHAYGAATDVPDGLAMLRSTDAAAREAARDGLWNVLDHQGIGRGPATAAALPFLIIALAADAATPARAELLRLLAELTVGDTWWWLHSGFHPSAQTRPDHCSRPQASVRGGARGGLPHRVPGSERRVRPDAGARPVRAVRVGRARRARVRARARRRRRDGARGG